MGEMTEEELEYEIALGLYLDIETRRQEIKKMAEFAIGELPENMRCHCCGKVILKKDRSMHFHHINCSKKYVGILIWREKKVDCYEEK